MVALIEPPPPTLPTTSTGGTTPSDDDYEAAVIANIHVQAADVHHIRSLISVMLDFSSMHFARWRDNVLLSLRRYSLSLSCHVLMDTMYVGVPSWDRMDSVKSWIYDTISADYRTSPSNVATWLVTPGWLWRTTSSAIMKLVPSTSTPPS
jgi:hypothetical protein